MTIVAAADGSALGNPGPAGWAWYVDETCWRAGGWPHGTNNMGELMAVLDLFKSTEHVADEPLHILCDSQYVINAVTKWMPGWKRKGWRKADGKPVLNLELLKDIDAAIAGRKYKFEWVKGHAGHDLNEAADDRARDAATAYQAKRTPNAGPGFPGSGLSNTSQPNTTQLNTDPAGAARAATTPVDVAQPELFSMSDDDQVLPAGRDDSLEAVVELERELFDPAVRADPLRVAELLHTDFEEIGASGSRWSRQEVLAMISDETVAAHSLEVLTLDRIDDSTALLTYRSDAPRGSALRSSIWKFAHGRWQIRFHQGTPEA
ncbi:ribonuclease HI family protein [Arthrobacter sp.]|uniref:ribonuclease HI family protein n=1 Tax=Arthrobacter sp. TaxID=1667 RepID=UPI0026E01A38|nr:ribonuclease HI family protein [Arthrobacter sp.]MDO5752985.1 ribonuclease HI family protein [Arthrobacter sp.]